jgi:hypothetical protein
MATAKFLKVMTKIMIELNKEHHVLVPNETKGWLLPMRVDKIKALLGDNAPEATDDHTWVEAFTDAYYMLPVAGRAVVALRYGLFSGIELDLGDVNLLTGIERHEVRAIETRSKRRIYEELGIAVSQEPQREVPVHVKVRRKMRRDARGVD